MDPRAHRESARTSDPAALADLVATIRQNLDHSRRQHLHEITTPINMAERFAQTEAANETEQDRRN